MNKRHKGWTRICLLLGILLFMAQACCTDNDGDGYAVEGDNCDTVDCNCGILDCNDEDAAVSPEADETCDDGIDNNCDGSIDEGCSSTTTTTTSTSSRFIDNGNGTVTDSLTGLIWLKVATCLGSMDWNAAPAAVDALSDGDCGFEGTLRDGSSPGDWRMPTKEEMQGLGTEPPTTWEEGRPPVDWTLVGGTTLTPFLYIQGNCFWTSTSDTDNAWVLCSGDGWVGLRDKTSYTYFVWPIRRDSN